MLATFLVVYRRICLSVRFGFFFPLRCLILFGLPDTGSSSYVPVLLCKGQKQLENSNLHLWSLFSRAGWEPADLHIKKKAKIGATCHVIEISSLRQKYVVMLVSKTTRLTDQPDLL